MNGSRRRPSAAERLYRRLLRLLPQEFRGDFGDSMARDFAERDRELTGARRRGFQARELPALAQTVVRQRVEDAWRDVRFGLRLMRRAPATTTAAILMLALGTGANAAMFSVIDAVLLRVPFTHPERIYLVRTTRPGSTDLWASMPVAMFESLARGRPGLESIAAMGLGQPILRDPVRPRRLNLECVTAGFFRVLGTPPLLGQGFGASDDRLGALPVIVASYDFWRRDLGGDRVAIGRQLRLDDQDVTVVGVMPRGFSGALQRNQLDGWIPLGPALAGAQPTPCRTGSTVNAFARAEPDVSQAQLTAALSAGAAFDSDGTTSATHSPRVALAPIEEEDTGDLRTPFLVLLGAVVCVLFIACANVANLLVERALGRRREWAMRLALGASPGRVFRQGLTEAVLLSITGGACGLALAYATLGLVVRVIPLGVQHVNEIEMNTRVLIATLGLAVVSGLGIGVLPSWQVFSKDVSTSLKESAGGATRAGRTWVRQALVAAELALSLVLLVGAVLMLRTFATLRPSEPGFEAERKTVATLSLGDDYKDEARRRDFATDLVRRVAAIPGVAGVSLTTYVPMSGMVGMAAVRRADEPGASPRNAWSGSVTPNYFDEMGIPLLLGRALTPADAEGAPHVALVNATMAKRFWPTGDAIGAEIITDLGGAPVRRTVVGIVRDTRSVGADTRTRPEVYWPYPQDPQMGFNLIIRTAGLSDPSDAALERAVNQAVAAIDPRQVVGRYETLGAVLDRGMAWPRFGLSLLGVFAALAIGLAAVGLASAIGWLVTQRTREIGVRLALGASRRQVLAPLVTQGLALAASGVAVGLAAAAGLSQLMASWVYGVKPLDARTFVESAAATLLIALVATYVPARRATAIDPIVTLRGD
jgi:putative ABC transport system permease protein